MTFGLPLSVILAFVFAKRPDSPDRTAVAGIRATTAIALSTLYILAFNLISPAFGDERINASEAIDMMRANRPLFTFLISGVLTYYLAVAKYSLRESARCRFRSARPGGVQRASFSGETTSSTGCR